jgi:hypothetical protein
MKPNQLITVMSGEHPFEGLSLPLLLVNPACLLPAFVHGENEAPIQ